MQFFNSWMLLGLLGVAVPVILHLLNRRHTKVIEWGAMRFLLDSLASRRRRVLLEEFLLLATRCLIVALVALALARPFVLDSSHVPWLVVLPAGLLAVVFFALNFALWRYPLWRRRVILAALTLALVAAGAVLGERWLNLERFGPGGARDVALVIDGSSSMTMTVDGRSNFARAVKEARQYIESMPRNYAFSIVIAGSAPNLPVPVPVTDRKHLMQVLEDALPVQGTMQAPDTLAVAATTLAQGVNPGKQIILIGDGQRLGWQPNHPETWEHLRAAFARLPSPPQVIFRRLALPETIRNATLSGINFSREVIGTDRDVRIDITVANTGTEAITPQEVRLTIGAFTASDRSLGQLAPGASATVSFQHRFEHAGAAVVRAEVVANDELPGDDESIRVVPVWDRLHVLVVDAMPTARLLDRAGTFVALALMPDAAALDQDLKPVAPISVTKPATVSAAPDFLVTPEMRAVPELAGYAAWSNADVVVLADVPRMPPETAAALADYVAHGGGLLMIAGLHVEPDFYNDWRGDDGSLMPLSLEKLVVSDENSRPVPDAKTFSHPALRAFASANDLAAAQFTCHWQTGEGDPAVRIGARLSNGMPLLAERRYGRGRVLQVNAPMDLSAGNLVARPAFVPLIHELIYHLARPLAADLNLQPSCGATIMLTEDHGGNREKNEDVEVATQIQGPQKQPLAGRYLVKNGGVALRVEGNLAPGLYHARVPETLRHKLGRLLDPDGAILFSVTVNGEESLLEPLSPDEVRLISRHVALRTARSAEDVLRALRGEAFGRELWQILMLAALALLILEIVLTRWIAIQRRTGAEGHVDFEDNAEDGAQSRTA